MQSFLTSQFNPYLTNGFSHHYQLDESIFIFRGIRSDFFLFFFSHFSMKFFKANRIAPDGTPRSAASHLGLFCLLMSRPIKGTPGLNEFMHMYVSIFQSFESLRLSRKRAKLF